MSRQQVVKKGQSYHHGPRNPALNSTLHMTHNVYAFTNTYVIYTDIYIIYDIFTFAFSWSTLLVIWLNTEANLTDFAFSQPASIGFQDTLFPLGRSTGRNKANTNIHSVVVCLSKNNFSTTVFSFGECFGFVVQFERYIYFLSKYTPSLGGWLVEDLGRTNFIIVFSK